MKKHPLRPAQGSFTTSDVAAILMIVVYTAALCITCVRKYQTFSYYDHDTAIANQLMWNGLCGHPFTSSLLGGTILRVHGSFAFALLLPFYALWPSPLTLLFLQALCLALAGWPIYLVAREDLGNGTEGLVLLVLYLLYPPLGYITLLHVHSVNFAPLPLAWAYYFFRGRRYLPFCATLAVAMSTREEIAFAAMALGAMALWERRPLKWSLVPLISGLAWFSVYFFWLAPRMGGASSSFGLFYQEVGGSAGAFLKNLLTRPHSVAAVMIQPHKLLYLFRMFAPVAFTPLLAPGVLFPAAPALLLNLLSSRGDVADIIFHYNCPIIPFVFFASSAGLARLLRHVRGEGRRLALSALLLTGLGLSWHLGPQLHLFSADWKGRTDCLPKQDFLAPVKWEMVSRIPPGVPVAATFPFFTPLSGRTGLDSLAWVLMGKVGIFPDPYKARDDIEYAMIDFGDPTTFVRFNAPGVGSARFRDYLVRNRLGLVKLHDRIALYKRDAPDIFSLYERLPGGSPGAPRADFGGLRLDDARLGVIGVPPRRQISLSTWWSAGIPVGEDLSMVLRVETPAGALLLQEVRSPCYYLFPTSEWSSGERVRATHLVALPPDAPPGEYRILLCVIGTFPPCRPRRYAAPARDITADGWLVVATFTLQPREAYGVFAGKDKVSLTRDLPSVPGGP